MAKSKSKSAVPVEATQLLVVGGGPVGLCAALCAARRGLDVTLVEENFRGYGPGRASLLHPASLRMLAELGLSQQLLSVGRALDAIHLYLDGALAVSLDLPLPVLTVPQAALEEILLKALRREGVRIQSPCEVTGLVQGPNSVRTTVARRELVRLGSPAHYSEWQPIDSFVVEAEFVIGADGYESYVRSALNIEHVTTGPTESFAVFEGPAFAAGPNMELGFDAELVSAVFPLAERRTRWGFQIASELSREPNLEFLCALLGERAPWLAGKPEAIDWSAVTHFESRCVRQFGRQRTWLAGDAAHVTSPFGGQSMNGGLLEVSELVERMADCLQRRSPLTSLEQWGTEREREWHQLLGQHAHIDTQPETPSWLRERAKRLVPALPASGRDLQHLLRELGFIVR